MPARETRPAEWVERTCDYVHCNQTYWTQYPGHHKYHSPDCAKAARHARHLAEYIPKQRLERRDNKWVIVQDPDPEGGLFAGLGMNKDEITTGLAMNSYTPGTIIKNRKTCKVYQVVDKGKHQKLVEVGA